jgi:hypothetical protein
MRKNGTNGNNEVVSLGLLAHGEVETVEKLVLENTDGVGVANGSLQQTLGVLGRVRRNDLKTGDRAVPGGVILGVLSSDTRGETVGTTESDVARLNTTGHVVGLGGGVDDLVNGLHGEVEGHELADGVKTSEGGTDSQTAETRLGDGRVDNTLLAESVKQTFGDLVAGKASCQLVNLHLSFNISVSDACHIRAKLRANMAASSCAYPILLNTANSHLQAYR